MKKTLNVNLSGSPFTIDEDAYSLLKEYLDDIRSRIGSDEAEVLSDVESRLAEIFLSNTAGRIRVVDLPMARAAIAVIGWANEFGNRTPGVAKSAKPPLSDVAPRPLYRNLSRKAIGGVCSGLADYLNCDTALVRIIMVLLVIFAGLSIWVYIIMWIVLPGYNEKQIEELKSRRRE